jgi:mycothiol system anti-sigma-R factor
MSHNCSQATKQLYQYLDAELDEKTASSLKSHLEDCGGCSGSFDFERRLKKVITMHLDEDMPENLLAKVRALIEDEKTVGSGY